MLAFLLAKPTQFDSAFFKWMHVNRADIPFIVYYWKPLSTSVNTDTETGASLQWGFNLLEGYPWKQANPNDPLAFVEMLQQAGVHYLVCNGWKQGFAPLVKASKRAGVLLGLRIDSVLWGKTNLELRLRKHFLKYAYSPFRHFFSSGSVCDEFLQVMGIPREKWRRWPYLIDRSLFARTPYIQQATHAIRQLYGIDDRPVVLGVCKWIARENPLELLRAFFGLNNQGLQLVMIGDGDLRTEIEEMVKAHPGLSIITPGYIQYSQLPAWYALASVFVHPAAYEPWGVSIHEAIASGCPVVVSSRVGSGYDLVQQGKNGFTYKAGDVGGLSDAITLSLSLDLIMFEQTRKKILEAWDYPFVAKQFEGLFTPPKIEVR